jgi:uncharacterized protein (TIGR02118 family)
MHKMIVLYNPPTDPAHFKKYYTEIHVPLAAKLPGLKAHRYAFDVKAMGGASPYFCVFEAEFADAAAMAAAMGSDAGKAVAGDVKNYATGGATILHYAVA